MNDAAKITAEHLRRTAYVYLRQSSPTQVEHNRESTRAQYALAAKVTELGWSQQQITVIDEDLGLSGSGAVERTGFARLTTEVALGHVGIVLGLEVSRLARNNADWHRLIELCGLTDTLIGDADGLYHPAMFNDRLLLGLKGAIEAKPNCISFAPVSTAAFAIRPLAASCVVVCPSVLYGEKPMVRCAFTLTKPYATPSA